MAFGAVLILYRTFGDKDFGLIYIVGFLSLKVMPAIWYLFSNSAFKVVERISLQILTQLMLEVYICLVLHYNLRQSTGKANLHPRRSELVSCIVYSYFTRSGRSK